MIAVRLHRSPILLLWALAGVNLLVVAAVPWVLFGLAPRTPFPGPSLGTAEVFASLEFVAAELLLLGFWTALYDPRYPVRWLTVITAIIISAVVFAADLHLLLWAFYPRVGFGRSGFEYRYVLVVGSAIAFIVVGFLFVLLTHCGLWLCRALFGWRLVLNEESRAMSQRQFGVAQGLLWIGLIGALLGLGRAFAGQDWFLPVVLAAVIAGVSATLLVAPTLWTFYGKRGSRWPLIRLLLFVTALSIAEGTASYHVSFLRGVFQVSWACVIVLTFNLSLVAVAWFNAWFMTNVGVRFITRRKRSPAGIEIAPATSPTLPR